MLLIAAIDSLLPAKIQLHFLSSSLIIALSYLSVRLSFKYRSSPLGSLLSFLFNIIFNEPSEQMTHVRILLGVVSGHVIYWIFVVCPTLPSYIRFFYSTLSHSSSQTTEASAEQPEESSVLESAIENHLLDTDIATPSHQSPPTSPIASSSSPPPPDYMSVD